MNQNNIEETPKNNTNFVLWCIVILLLIIAAPIMYNMFWNSMAFLQPQMPANTIGGN